MNITDKLTDTANDHLKPLRKMLLPLVKSNKLDAFDYLNVLARVDELMTPANQHSKKFDSAEQALNHLLEINELSFAEVKEALEAYIEKQIVG